MARWRARPASHARRLWALLILLDILPWPRGEDILAGMFMVVGLARPGRRRRALILARAMGHTRPWRVAAALCAFLGRWVARMYLLGVRRPEDLRRILVMEGAHHLDAVPGPAILLGFHLGPPSGDMIFRVLGVPVTYLGWHDRDASLAWWSEEWRPFAQSAPLSRARGDRDNWPAVLYQARQILVDGGKVHIRADGEGREVFRLPLSVGEFPIAAGWLTLHRLTGAPVVPVLDHLDGRRHVVAIHPALPAVDLDRPEGLGVWRQRLTDLVEDYIGRFPEQCPHLALVIDPATRPVTVPTT